MLTPAGASHHVAVQHEAVKRTDPATGSWAGSGYANARNASTMTATPKTAAITLIQTIRVSGCGGHAVMRGSPGGGLWRAPGRRSRPSAGRARSRSVLPGSGSCRLLLVILHH